MILHLLKRPPLSTYFLHLFSLLSLATAHAAPTATSAISAKAYVQDGLVAQWDGIENAGYGQHDDAATYPRELVSDISQTLSGTIAAGSDYFSLGSGYLKFKLASALTAINAGSASVEMRVQKDGTMVNNGGLVALGSATRGFWTWQNASYLLSSYSYHSKATGEYVGVNENADSAKTFSFLLGSTTAESWYAVDGVRKAGLTRHATDCATDDDCFIGTIGYTYVDTKANARMYSVRIYNRMLSTLEIGRNNAIDRMRFAGATSNDTGYAWIDGAIHTRVAVSASDGGTVSLNGGGASTSTNAWSAATNSFTAVAVPSAGYVFARWSGDTSGLTDTQIVQTNLTLVADTPRQLAATFRVPGVKKWRWSVNALASNAANWTDENGAAVASAPGTGDAVVLDGTCVSNLTWDINDVTLASWKQDGYTGTVTFRTGETGTGFGAVRGMPQDDGTRALAVTGDVTLATGKWSHEAQPSGLGFGTTSASQSGRGVYRFIARIGGDLTLGASAAINVNQKGFSKAGPYEATNGFGHGGQGSGYWGTEGVNLPYGSVKRPRTLGAGIEAAGGGSIEIRTSGEATINGTLTTRGYGSFWSTGSTGSGGSIWLTAKSLAGTGTFDARAGKSGGGGYASGGRIAVHLTGEDEDFSDFTGSMDASFEGTKMTHPGTIYLQTAADDGKGELIIRGIGSTAGQIYGTVRNGGTPIAMPDDDDHDLKRVKMINHVQARVDKGLHVRVGEFYSQGTVDYQWLLLCGGTLEVPDGWTPSNMWLRVFTAGSTLRLGSNGDGTLNMTNGAVAYWDRNMTIEGNLHVRKGGLVSHTYNGTSDKSYRLNPSVTGWITVDSGGSISTGGQGYEKAYGPGTPSVTGYTDRGGTYGGCACDNGGVTCYGSVRSPTHLGSGGGRSAGGGAMKLVVEGAVTNNGFIGSNGAGDWNAGSGGSVWIVATNIVGAGTIAANGGGGADKKYVANYAYPGGGGRVSLKLTDPNASFADFTGTVSAYGGVFSDSYAGAGAGTVYRETATQEAGQGSLEIRQRTANWYFSIAPTQITPGMTETDVGDVVVTNNAWLSILKGGTLTVRGDFAKYGLPMDDLGEISDGTLEAGTVSFADASRLSRVTGENRFARLAITEPGKTVRFGAAADTLTTVISGGVFAVTGEEGNLVNLRGKADGTPWKLQVDSSAATSVTYADVQDSDASEGMKVVVDDTSHDSGNNVNWGFVTIVPGETIVWTGTKSSAWGDPDNWDRGRAPVETDVISIVASDNVPTLSAATTCARLSVAHGATLNLAGFDLSVTGSVSCAGTLSAGGASNIRVEGDLSFLNGSFVKGESTVWLVGAARQTVNFAGQDLHTVVVSNDVNFTSGFSVDFFTCETEVARTLRFAAGEQVSTKTLTLQGASGETPLLTLASRTSGEAWKISYTAKASVCGVAVSDSTAVGREIAAETPSTDGGGNVNWRFGVSAATWTGAVNALWSNAGNWSGGAVPDETSRVVFDKAASVTMPSAAVTVRAVEISGATVTLTGLGAAQGIETTTYFEVLDGGTVCLDTRVTVGGECYLRSGGTVTHSANGSSSKSTDRGVGVYLTVAGDMIIEEGGKISVTACGFYNGYGTGYHQQYPCYGGRGYAGSTVVAYGSIFNPAELGSGGQVGVGGGRVLLSVGGTLTANGEIASDGAYTWDYASAGGCINVKCGTLAGSGFVHARGGNYWLNAAPGCGGRVAIYQTVAKTLSAWAGTICAWGGLKYTPTGTPSRLPGSVYLESADDGARGGTIVVDNNGGSTGDGGVDLPVTKNCSDTVKDYRAATVRVVNNGSLYITGDVEIRELEIVSGRINLNGHTLTIKSWVHHNGKGWPKNWSTAIVYPGTGGKIVWKPRPLCVIVR